MYKAVYKLI